MKPDNKSMNELASSLDSFADQATTDRIRNPYALE